jgi:Cu+-exporting ATPase
MKKHWLGWMVLPIALVAVGSASTLRGSSAEAVPAAVVADTARAVVEVKGMSCSSCATNVQAMLKRTPGVIAARVSVERAEAVVDYDPVRTSPPRIVETIKRLGYMARLKEPSKGKARSGT